MGITKNWSPSKWRLSYKAKPKVRRKVTMKRHISNMAKMKKDLAALRKQEDKIRQKRFKILNRK